MEGGSAAERTQATRGCSGGSDPVTETLDVTEILIIIAHLCLAARRPLSITSAQGFPLTKGLWSADSLYLSLLPLISLHPSGWGSQLLPISLVSFVDAINKRFSSSSRAPEKADNKTRPTTDTCISP